VTSPTADDFGIYTYAAVTQTPDGGAAAPVGILYKLELKFIPSLSK
jgi:hypothetical protein